MISSTKKLGFGSLALAALLSCGTGAVLAQGSHDQDHHYDDHHDNGQHENDRHDNGQHDNGRHEDDRHDNGQHRGLERNNAPAAAYRFSGGDRDRFNRFYRSDAARWRGRRRPNFYKGYAIPRNYALRPVPSSYWEGGPPPPGYQYGYYDGYVVAYNPATRIIADVLDLAAGSY